MSDRGDERVGDAERQQVIDLLRAHTGAGRLTLDEFSDLAGDVFAARTRAELDKVLEGLPPGVSTTMPEPPAPPPPAAAGVPATTHPARKLLVGIMNGRNTRGRWHAPAHITAFACMGSVKVDLRSALIESPVVDIIAWAIMGSVDVVVPAGVAVELDGMVVMGGSGDRTRPGEVLPGTPLVRVHARGLWGGVGARTGRPRGSRRDRDRDRDRDHRHGWDEATPAFGVPVAPTPPRHPQAPQPPSPPQLPMPNLADIADMIAGLDIKRMRRERMQPHPRYRNNGDDRSARPRSRYSEAPSDGDAPAAGPSGTLTMMVTDVVGSTRLAEALGDRRWMELMNDHNALVREQVGKHGGTEVKAQGDGFLVVFASARRAILAAVDVQRALAGYRDEHPDHPLDMRIGLHTGEIVDVDGDVFGQNVVVAVRIADHAAPGEILVSGLTRDLTQAGGDLCFDDGHELDLKGLSQPWRVHRVSWSTEPA
jgi:class 3 adenylate cyclase